MLLRAAQWQNSAVIMRKPGLDLHPVHIAYFHARNPQWVLCKLM
jgi:hypothetical protein